MRSNKTVLLLTLITSLFSIYYLSFTFVDFQIQRKAEQQAMDEAQKIDFDKSQAYLMDLWNKPVYNVFGLSYTYEEVKERSLKLGLDLQGGMHVTMELCPIELVKALASNPTHPAFLEALECAQKEREQGASLSFSKLFMAAYKRLAPNEDVIDIFSTDANQSRAYTFAKEQDICKAIDQEIEKALLRSLSILRARLDRFGASQPNIQKLPGTGRIQIELPGVKHPERVRKLLQGVAKLRFWEVASVEEYGPHLQAVDDFLLKEEQAMLKSSFASDMTEAEQAERLPKQSILIRYSAYPFPYRLTYPIEVVDQIEALLRRKEVKALLPQQLLFMWENKTHCLKEGKETITLYPIKQTWDHKPLLEGTIITHAAQMLDESGRPVVSMQMNGEGARIWKRVTANNIGKCIAITLDDRVYSAPVVNQEIPNGYSQISGSLTIEEAKDLASVLQTGSLPAQLKVVEEAVIGPSLGKMAQQQGILATAVGLGLVLLFMVLYYAKAGVIANLALCFNLLFIVGILAQMDATLTLPGIAGLVLTIGMSIDANVLIFERIREELANNVQIKEAIKRGYAKSYSSIIDSNITTFLVGVVLYYLGKGQVRGFALVLMVGIISSFFASVCITQLLFSFALRKPTPMLSFSYGTTPSFLKNVSFDFIKYRFIFYIASFSYIALGAFCLYQQKGIPLGVDFSGGRSYVVNFSRPIDPSLLKEKLVAHFPEGIAVRSYGANNVVQLTTSYLSQEDATQADTQARNKIVACLKGATSFSASGIEEPSENHFSITSSTNVGANVAQDVQKSAKYAILCSLLGIFFYVAFRFRKWQFGLASVIALIHDACAVLAGFAIARAMGFNYEVNEVFLAAMLTIIGYSINDTVVIFDRIRERFNVKAKKMEATFMNCAIQETLSRTLITSLTTLVVVVVLFLFGGEALRGFSFALMLGIVFGTYSSICIATPLLADFRKKRP
ncbi:MAG TPA: protein translocase subunit SecDF [Amoebophilaceae bacterium]|nr:protein translocase subunit SecDF [Amoebophilaceae bacterium]